MQRSSGPVDSMAGAGGMMMVAGEKFGAEAGVIKAEEKAVVARCHECGRSTRDKGP